MNISVALGRPLLQLFPETVVPVSRIRILRAMCFGIDPLVAPSHRLMQTGKRLRNPELRRILEDQEMGTWSISPATANFLETEIKTRRPNAVLEFGSGLSTICLAHWMYEQHGPSERVYVCSIEQDAAVLEKIAGRLRELRLTSFVRLFHCPLRQQVILGRSQSGYCLSNELTDFLKTFQPEFVLVDGPAAEDGARFATIPAIHSHLHKPYRFYLDDALRDGELEIAKLWSTLSYMHVEGIYVTEKGMLVGKAVPESTEDSDDAA